MTKRQTYLWKPRPGDDMAAFSLIEDYGVHKWSIIENSAKTWFRRNKSQEVLVKVTKRYDDNHGIEVWAYAKDLYPE